VSDVYLNLFRGVIPSIAGGVLCRTLARSAFGRLPKASLSTSYCLGWRPQAPVRLGQPAARAALAGGVRPAVSRVSLFTQGSTSADPNPDHDPGPGPDPGPNLDPYPQPLPGLDISPIAAFFVLNLLTSSVASLGNPNPNPNPTPNPHPCDPNPDTSAVASLGTSTRI
jgi:hypothetical protein